VRGMFESVLECPRLSMNNASDSSTVVHVLAGVMLLAGLCSRSRSRKEFLGGVGVGKNVPTPTPISV
jgi:hypothetical protein